MDNRVKNISIIVPVYNAERYLERCLDSLLSQTEKNIEIICVNDGSTDKSLETLRLYEARDPRIRILDKENGGAATARNEGIRIAVGKYLLFVDADDFVEAELCETVFTRAEETGADITLFNADFYNPNTGKFNEVGWLLNKDYLPKRDTFSRKDLPRELFMSVSGGPCNKLFNREFIVKNNIDFPVMPSLEDVPFVYTAMAVADKIAYVDKVLEHYRRHAGGTNLVSRINLYPERIFDSFGILKSRLEERGLFDELYSAFINRAAVDFVDQFLYTIKDPHAANYFKLYLSRKASYEFGLRGLPRSAFVKEHTYNKLSELYSSDGYYEKLDGEATPKISVIVPVYNAELYLRECINSILFQSFRSFELILVDDGSTDNSLSILKAYEKLDKRVKVLTQKNKFAGAARNLGISAARGKYLQFLDSDDFFEYNMLDTLYKAAEKNSAEVVLCDGNYYDNVTRISTPARFLLQKYNIPKKKVFSYRDNPDKILHVTIDCPWNKLFLKSFVDKHSLQFQILRSANDVYFVDSALILADRISVADARLVNYRTNVKTSLQANRAKEPLNFYQALTAVRERVKGEERFSSVKRSLVSLFVFACRHHLDKARDREEFDLLYAFYKDSAFDAWELDPSDKAAFVYEDERLWLERVLESDPEEYIAKGRIKGEIAFINKQKFVAKNILKSLPRKVLEELGKVPDVIVSMTSFPARIHSVHQVVRNMAEQTVKPDRILLYLAKSQFPTLEKELPEQLLECRSLGLEIKWCDEDIRPHKKYFYVMKEYPDDLVITVDDDLVYRVDMIEKLLNSYVRYPSAVSAMRAHLITEDKDGGVAPYKDWKKEFSGILNTPSMQLFSTSGGGTLYPPRCMGEELFDLETIKSSCINADDIWLKIMQLCSNVPVVLAHPNEELIYIDGTQENRLYTVNVEEGENDSQFTDTVKKYDAMLEGEERLTERIFRERITLTPDGKAAISGGSVDAKALASLNCELEKIKSSVSYRAGRLITWLPRKLFGGVKCLSENGIKYTLGRILVKLHLKEDPYK